jgi:hypothetical protein
MARKNLRSRGEILSGDAIDLSVEPKTSNKNNQQPEN